MRSLIEGPCTIRFYLEPSLKRPWLIEIPDRNKFYGHKIIKMRELDIDVSMHSEIDETNGKQRRYKLVTEPSVFIYHDDEGYCCITRTREELEALENIPSVHDVG